MSPQDRHYLNKALVYLQIQREFSSLSAVGNLSHYAEPFLPYPNGSNSRAADAKQDQTFFGSLWGPAASKRDPEWKDYQWEDDGGDSPLLRYMFWRFIYNFPCLREAKPAYWTSQIQTFFDSFAERNLSTTSERSEVTKRRLLSTGLSRLLGTYYSVCMPPSGPHAPARLSLSLVERIDDLVPAVQKDVWVKMGKRANQLRNGWTNYRRALINDEELDLTMELVRKTPKIKGLPQQHRDAQEWASIWVAYALHFLYTSSPNAAEATGLLKSFHQMIPYSALKLGLNIMNPTLALKAVISIVLGQPGGQSSLFQRVFSAVIGSGLRGRKKRIDALRVKLSDYGGICEAIRSHVNAPFNQRNATRATSQSKAEAILVTIVRDHGSERDVQVVDKWRRDFEQYPVSVEDATDAGRFLTLRLLMREECVKRDHEQVLQTALEYNTPVVIRSSISVFYDAIYKIANTSQLAQRLGDLQSFIDDLLRVAQSSNNAPADYIKLARKHEQNLYYFVHEMASNGGNMMDPLLEWCRSGLRFARDGIPTPCVSEPHTSTSIADSTPENIQSASRAGVDYDALLSSLPTDIKEAVLEEVRGLALWTTYKKCWADISLRVDLLAAEGADLKLDKAELYTRLLAQDSDVLDAIARRCSAPEGETRPEDGVTWAWFADDDVLNSPTSIKVDWKAAAAIEKSAVEARRRDRQTSDAEDRLRREVPGPKVKAIKTLLDRYAAVIKNSSDAAWTAKVK